MSAGAVASAASAAQPAPLSLPLSLPSAYDNTMLNLFRECPSKFYLAYMCGHRPKHEAAALIWGAAYHKVTETFDQQILRSTREEALKIAFRLALQLSEPPFCPGDNTRTRLGLLRALVWYSEQFREDVLETFILANDRPALELSFRFELPLTNHEGVPYIYCGHIDKIARMKTTKQLYCVERKHTTTTLGDHYFQRYFFTSQVSGYAAAGKICFEKEIEGAIIESCQIAQNFCRFGRAAIHRVNSHLEEWLDDTCYWIKQVERCFAERFWPHNTESCSKYSGCQFRGVCSKAPSVRQLVLDSEFKIDRWEPLTNRGD